MSKEYKVCLFKSPVCGPCKMFQPQLEKAVELFNNENTGSKVIFEIIDVSTDEGLEVASKYGIDSSGQAILLNNDVALMIWNRPCAFSTVLNDLKMYCL